MKLNDVCGAIVKWRNSINAACLNRYGLDLLRLLAFNFGHAITLKMPGLGTGNCNACLLHGLLFFGLRGSIGKATYHGLSTLYGHVVGAVIGMSALYLFPANYWRLVVFTVLATFISALMQNPSTNFFGLICIIFMSSVILSNWETPYADVQMYDMFSDFYGTCAAVAANILFHFVCPMPSSRQNLYKGLADRIREASSRTSQYTEHVMKLYASTDRDYIGYLPQDDNILSHCVGPEFTPQSDIFEMHSELGVTQREVDAARCVVQAVDSLFIAVESMAMPFCRREAKCSRKDEPQPKAGGFAPGAKPLETRRGSVNTQSTEDKQARELETRRLPMLLSKWTEWKSANDKAVDGKKLEIPRFKVLQECHKQLLLQLAQQLEIACERAPDRRFPRRSVKELLSRAYDSLLSEHDVSHANSSEGDSMQLLKRPEVLDVLSGGGLLNVDIIQKFYDSVEHQFWPLFAHSKFNHMFSNDFDSLAVLCGVNGMQLLQEAAMCISPLRCWCSVAVLFYTLSSSFQENPKPSFIQSACHYALRFSRILAAPVVAIFAVLLRQYKKLVKDPKKFWKKNFRTDLGDGLYLLKFGIGLLLMNVPTMVIPGLDEVFNNNHGSWIVFSYMFCLDKTRESSFRNSLYRLLSTAAAGVLGLFAVFILDYSTIAFNIFCTAGIGCIAGGVKAPLRRFMSTFLSAFIVCVSCPLTYGSEPSYSDLLYRVLSVVIGGAAAVGVSSFLWPISAYKRAKIEIATSVKRITECLQRTEPYFVDHMVPATKIPANRSFSGGSASETDTVSTAPVSAAAVSLKHWLREHLRNEITVHELEGDSSTLLQVSKSQVDDISDLLSASFGSLRCALSMIEMIDIAQNARAKAIMSRVEKHYAKIEQVRQQLFVTLLLHMSVSMSVQALFRPPVGKNAFELGFYASLRVLEENYIEKHRNQNASLHHAGDFERIVKVELKNVIVLLNTWEVKVWPKQKRLCVLADASVCVATSHCLSIQSNVDAQLDKLTSCEQPVSSASETPSAASSVPSSPRGRPLFDDFAFTETKLNRSEVLVPNFSFGFSCIPDNFIERSKQIQ
jgi:hypothetical protein